MLLVVSVTSQAKERTRQRVRGRTLAMDSSAASSWHLDSTLRDQSTLLVAWQKAARTSNDKVGEHSGKEED